MGIITRIGHWLDKRFPEKIEAEAVMKWIEEFNKEVKVLYKTIEGFDVRLADLQNFVSDIEKLKSDVQKLQALSVVKSKVANYQGNMNPGNWPLPPVMPGPTIK